MARPDIEQPADHLLTPVQAIIAALVLAAVVVGQLALTEDADRAVTAALSAQAVVAIYLGFAIVRGRWGELATETAFFAFASVLISLGKDGAEGCLAAVFLVHGGWDLLHHRHDRFPRVGARNVPRWYPPACLAFDWPVAVAVLVLVP